MNKIKEKKSRQRLTPQDRYAQLLNLAIDLYARKGVGRVGHGDIAKLANVSTGTVFNYFPTIEALNAAVLSMVRKTTLGIFKDKPEDASRGSSLMFFSAQLLNIVERQPAIFKIFLSWSHSFDDPFREEFLKFKKEIMDIVKALLNCRDQGDIDAHILYGMGVLCGQMKLENQSDEDLMKLARRVVDLVL